MRWSEFEAGAPDMAALARERLEDRHLCLVGTLRTDGWPRISPVEPYIVQGELMLGMMPGSRKALDLLRDPRVVVHSVVTDWEGSEGDVKLYGHAAEVMDEDRRLELFQAVANAHRWAEAHDPDPRGGSHVFAVDIASAAFVRFGPDTWEIWRWDPDAGLMKDVHPNE